MRSMTGFGRGTATWNDRGVVLEIKTVNHRYLELRVRAPKEMLAAEAAIEQQVRRGLSRGYCTVSLEVEGSSQPAVTLHAEALGALLGKLRAVAQEHNLDLRDLTPVLAQAPELFSAPAMIDPAQGLLTAVEAACDAAMTELLHSRAVEGANVASAISPLMAALRAKTQEIAEFAAEWPKTARARLNARLSELVQDISRLDPQRLEQEVAVLADRADVTEELSRIDAHVTELERLQGNDAPMGRRLEFLLQELGREVNTLGSKAALQQISSRVIDIKSDLDKLRELAANVE